MLTFKRLAIALSCLGAALLCACESAPLNVRLPNPLNLRLPTSRPANVPIAANQERVAYDLASLPRGTNSDSLLILMAFSGGGKRSASFSYGILRELSKTRISWEGKEKRLLDEVDVINAVSGGSFTAAYYGLYRDRIFEDYAGKFLKNDTNLAIGANVLQPVNFIRTWSGEFGTNDVAAEYYERSLFGKATYRDLLARGRPLINISATDINLGTVFVFNQGYFDLICSDLAAFPLARAVAASNGFPLLFTPITVRNYSAKCPVSADTRRIDFKRADPLSRRRYVQQTLSSYINAKRTEYVHLMDGGISDNLALRGTLNTLAALGSSGAVRASRLGHVRHVVIIVADGQATPKKGWEARRTVSGALQILASLSGSQIDAYNFETLILARRALDFLGRALKQLQCKDIPGGRRARRKNGKAEPCRPIETYFIHATLQNVSDRNLRHRLNDIPTTLSLERGQAELISKTAGQLLREHPDYQRLVRNLSRTSAHNPANREKRARR